MWMHANHDVLELKDDSGEKEAAEDCSTTGRRASRGAEFSARGCFGKFSGGENKTPALSIDTAASQAVYLGPLEEKNQEPFGCV
jgi:hypothetical protein